MMVNLLTKLANNLPLELTQKVLVSAPRIIPQTALSLFVEKILNRQFKPLIEQAEFDFLEQRTIELHCTDNHVRLQISYAQAQQKLLVNMHELSTAPCATLSGTLASFLCLASGEIDPDTLFFRRKLAIAGDTELCLEVKNLLDSLEPEQLIPSFIYQPFQQYSLRVRAHYLQQEPRI